MVDLLLARIRDWDRRTADRVTHFIAISETVRDASANATAATAVVIYPPVDTDFYTPGDEPREDFYLVVSAFAPYKRLDLAIEACRNSAGNSSSSAAGRTRRAAGERRVPNVSFLGWQPDEVIRDHLRRAGRCSFPARKISASCRSRRRRADAR